MIRYRSTDDPFWGTELPRVSEYDTDGCLMLLAAIVRRWWLDGLHEQRMLKELAEFIECDVRILRDTRPATFYSRSTGDWRQQ